MKNIIILILLGLTACNPYDKVHYPKVLECKKDGEVIFTSDPWDEIRMDGADWIFLSRNSGEAKGSYSTPATNVYCVVKELESAE